MNPISVQAPPNLQHLLSSAALTATERRIADHLSLIWPELPMTSAAEVALELGVNASSVTRLAQTLGYRGYPDLQRAARLELRQQHKPAPLPSDSQAAAHWEREIRLFESLLSWPEAELDACADLLAGARRVYVTGARGSAPAAQYAAHLWSSVREGVHWVSANRDSVNGWLDAGAGDLLVAFTFRRYARSTAELCQAVTAQGAALLLITDSYAAPGVRLARARLVLPADAAQLGDGHFMSLSAAVSLTSLLASKLTARVGTERLQALERTLGEQDVYTY